MTSPLQARQAAVEAMAEAMSDERYGVDTWRTMNSKHKAFWFRITEAGLNVLLGTPDTPCPECRGKGSFTISAHSPSGIMHSEDTCLVCGGSGVVPGQPALRMPCETCGGKGYQADFYPSPEYDHLPCPDCTNGFGLAAIDVARGAEQ